MSTLHLVQGPVGQLEGRGECAGEERTGEEESMEGSRGEQGGGDEGTEEEDSLQDHRERIGEEERREGRGEESNREERGVAVEVGEREEQRPSEKKMEAEGEGQDGGGEERFGDDTEKAAVEVGKEKTFSAIVQEGNRPRASHKEEEEEDEEVREHFLVKCFNILRSSNSLAGELLEQDGERVQW